MLSPLPTRAGEDGSGDSEGPMSVARACLNTYLLRLSRQPSTTNKSPGNPPSASTPNRSLIGYVVPQDDGHASSNRREDDGAGDPDPLSLTQTDTQWVA